MSITKFSRPVLPLDCRYASAADSLRASFHPSIHGCCTRQSSTRVTDQVKNALSDGSYTQAMQSLIPVGNVRTATIGYAATTWELEEFAHGAKRCRSVCYTRHPDPMPVLLDETPLYTLKCASYAQTVSLQHTQHGLKDGCVGNDALSFSIGRVDFFLQGPKPASFDIR